MIFLSTRVQNSISYPKNWGSITVFPRFLIKCRQRGASPWAHNEAGPQLVSVKFIETFSFRWNAEPSQASAMICHCPGTLSRIEHDQFSANRSEFAEFRTTVSNAQGRTTVQKARYALLSCFPSSWWFVQIEQNIWHLPTKIRRLATRPLSHNWIPQLYGFTDSFSPASKSSSLYF